MKKTILASLAAVALAASTVFATVTFDPNTGTGFVGKGDVQLAFGWNNAALQTNAAGVTFTYNVTNSYTAVCTWVTGEGTRGEQTHNVNHTKASSLVGNVIVDARTRTQITGFNLTGWMGDEPTETGETPVEGGACPGNPGTDGVWTSVSLTGSVAGLFVNYSGYLPVKIW
jgi:hypothetical protein